MNHVSSADIHVEINERPMSPFQIGVIGLCVMINMLDGFDVMVMPFAAASRSRAFWRCLGPQEADASLLVYCDFGYAFVLSSRFQLSADDIPILDRSWYRRNVSHAEYPCV